MIRTIWVLWLIFSFNGLTFAMTEAEVEIVTNSVLEICRGGKIGGKNSSVRIKGEGKLTTVVIKKLVQAELGGEAQFSREEWDGIKPLLHDSFDSNAYVKCVTELTPIFLNKFSASTATMPPIIASFESSPKQVSHRGQAKLTWKVSKATSVEISPGIGNVALEGRTIVSPSSTTTYSLVAQNGSQSATATTKITVKRQGHLQVRTSKASPSVKPGERFTIYVTVLDKDGQRVPSATVLVEVGGGKFLNAANAAYDPKARLHGPYSISGKTAQDGVYTAWWVCNPCARSYTMSAKVSKEGYQEAKSEFSADIR